LDRLQIEIVNTGSELMLGRVLNTHQQWLCRQLSDAGYEVVRQVAVPDAAEAIGEAVEEALQRADLVLTTGGLGPTSDDLTRAEISRRLGLETHVDRGVLEVIEEFFRRRGREVLESVKVQALVPEGAVVLPNAHGTAPGLRIEVPSRARGGGRAAHVVLLPGPPRELRPMFAEQVLPWLLRAFPPSAERAARVLRAAGWGESAIEETIGPALAGLVAEGLVLGYCARPGDVEVRLESRGEGAAGRVAAAESVVRHRLGGAIYGAGEETMEGVTVGMLRERGRTLAVAESCTGGLVAHRVTNVPGASEVFLAGWVTYSNAAKTRWLGVPAQLLAEEGAVSAAVARAMAEGVRKESGADYGLALTGIAGPGGGSPAKPVGTVFMALAEACGTRVEHHLNAMDRETFKWIASQQALDMARRELIESDG